MNAWTLHHIVAICQDCPWTLEHHGPDPVDVLGHARRHAKFHRHYVQVERGQHAHYDERRSEPT